MSDPLLLDPAHRVADPSPPDALALAAALVRCPSVTPDEGGALRLLEGVLAPAGFECHRVDRGGVSNLFARLGPRGARRTLGFNGHTDVVPRARWARGRATRSAARWPTGGFGAGARPT